MMQALVRDWLEDLKSFDLSTWAITVALAAFVLFGASRGYQRYVTYREQEAQLAMSEAFTEYDHAVYQRLEGAQSDEVIGQKLADAHLGFDVVLNSHTHSALIPYAYAFEADVYWYEGKKAEALVAMEKAIKKAKKSHLYYPMLTKFALMKMDADRFEEGMAELQSLARNEKNPNADLAAFYLGYYYWCGDDLEKATEAWSLLEKFDGSKGVKHGASPLLGIARMKLGLVS